MRRVVAEVALHVREAPREAVEHLLVDRLPGRLDRRPRSVAQLFDRPVVDGDADDRAVEQPAGLEPVEEWKVITFARSPVIPKITKTSAALSAEEALVVAGRVIVVAIVTSFGRGGRRYARTGGPGIPQTG